ncbi:MAG: heat-inducible transcriptional repressor HrcA [Alphaproteobacteria bacterium]|jgi:heat-inducible transcriptional repressor|nr:heat-inducible transcriptional repressor HrcA [Alphaproteobacteria bacterium]
MSLTVAELNQRSLEIFRELVDTYVETGEPVGSRTLSRRLNTPLSPATIRNIMADLEEAGLLYAPHTSAGRLPTDEGLRLFVHGLLEIGDLNEQERKNIDKLCNNSNRSISSVLEEATTMLSGLSKCAGLVMAPKADAPLKHIEFVQIAPGRALVVLINQDGDVENRLIEVPSGISSSVFSEASNYLSSRLAGFTLAQAKNVINEELKNHQAHLSELTANVVSAGLAVWAGGEEGSSLIVKGQSNLLHGVTEVNELDQIRELFQVLDTKERLSELLDASIKAEGVQIFIGSENSLFKLSGCSLVVSPYHNSRQKIIGAIGVIGPARMNYGRIIPLVDYTAKMVSRLIG